MNPDDKEAGRFYCTIKITINQTNIRDEPVEKKCDCPEKFTIPFLDVSCTIEDGKIKTDLCKKETDKNQYLMLSSCHPKQTTKTIPFSLALRIVRVCSSQEERDKRLIELKDRLLARDYNRGLVQAALDKAREVPRSRALKDVKNQTKPRGLC